MSELGRQGGVKGGKATAEMLTAEERAEIARKAPLVRWAARRGKICGWPCRMN